MNPIDKILLELANDVDEYLAQTNVPLEQYQQDIGLKIDQARAKIAKLSLLESNEIELLSKAFWFSVKDINVAIYYPDFEFKFIDKPHVWQNYIPINIAHEWKTLSREVRAALFCMAETEAQKEEWD